jgi:parafibromin
VVVGAAPVPSAASATVESVSVALEATAEAGPSKVAPVKRKYEVDVADREFCKKVSPNFEVQPLKGLDLKGLDNHGSRLTAQLRAEEIELRDRNSVLRTAGGGKVHVSTAMPHSCGATNDL